MEVHLKKLIFLTNIQQPFTWLGLSWDDKLQITYLYPRYSYSYFITSATSVVSSSLECEPIRVILKGWNRLFQTPLSLEMSSSHDSKVLLTACRMMVFFFPQCRRDGEERVPGALWPASFVDMANSSPVQGAKSVSKIRWRVM